MALGWVTLVVGMLSVGAVALWFVTGSTQKNIARATVAHAYLDVASSALSEIVAQIRTSCIKKQPYDGRDFGPLLSTAYPPAPASFEPKLTREAFKKLYPDLTISAVSFECLDRSIPGQTDPVVGMLELKVKVEGRVAGWTMGREVTQRVVFQVPCATWRTAGPGGNFKTPQWGNVNVVPYPEAQEVKNL